MKVPIPDSMSHESPLADPLVFSLCRYMAKWQWGLIFLLCICGYAGSLLLRVGYSAVRLYKPLTVVAALIVEHKLQVQGLH